MLVLEFVTLSNDKKVSVVVDLVVVEVEAVVVVVVIVVDGDVVVSGVWVVDETSVL